MAALTVSTSDAVTAIRGAINDHAALINASPGYDSGPLGSRPTSTSGTPGVEGRLYLVTDGPVPILYRDTGTGWAPMTAVTFSAKPSVSTNTLPAGGTATKVLCDSEEWDDAGWYTAATSRFVPQVAGVYELTGRVILLDPLGASQHLGVAIYKNGALAENLARSEAGGTAPLVQATGSVLVAANGSSDYFELWAYQNDSATRRYAGDDSGVHRTRFQGKLIRPS